jgi:hypothetical protein
MSRRFSIGILAARPPENLVPNAITIILGD